tara:strand:- start:576 stop:881 length:306 start_codon:yes stop_codon:yes gene_type:complete
MHWAVRKKEQTALIEIIKDQVEGIAFDTPVHVEYTRKSIRYMDWDNAAGSFKLLGDALVTLGVIPDDNPSVITKFQVNQEKVSKRIEQGFQCKIYPSSSVS